MRITFYFAILCAVVQSCQPSERANSSAIAFTGATIIDGNGGEPITDGIIVVENGLIVSVGPKSTITVPNHATTIDLSGKTVIPGIINAHGHVGDVKGIEGGHYSHENVIDNLSIYARYGVTTVISLGGDKKEAEDLRFVNDSTSTNRARLFIAGDIINGKTAAEAMTVIDSNAHLGVDFMKIRVDDNLGTSSKMSDDIYDPVIKRSHQLGYKIATHMYYLEDARRLLQSGTDMLAHSVRDLPIDEPFIALLKEKNVPYCATLTRELSTFVYGDTADFFEDPFFTREYDSAVFAPLKDPARQLQIRNSQSAKTYRQQLPVAMANLKTLQDAGCHIVFGTDSGVPTRFIGYFEHLEMSMMADAGLSPMEIIMSFSKNAAEFMGLKNLGTIEPGHHADLVVLDANPLTDIKNCRKIFRVYINGKDVK